MDLAAFNSKLSSLDAHFKAAASSVEPQTIAHSQANFKLGLFELSIMINQLFASNRAVIANSIDDDSKKKIAELEDETELLYDVIKTQGVQIYNLTSDAAAKDARIVKLSKENEKIAVLSDKVITLEKRIEQLTVENLAFDEFLSNHTEPSGMCNELEVRNFQAHQLFRRTQIQAANIENLKVDFAGCMNNLKAAKDDLDFYKGMSERLLRENKGLEEDLKVNKHSHDISELETSVHTDGEFYLGDDKIDRTLNTAFQIVKHVEKSSPSEGQVTCTMKNKKRRPRRPRRRFIKLSTKELDKFYDSGVYAPLKFNL